MAAVNSALRRDLIRERPTTIGWGLELAEREAGESAWELVTREDALALARLSANALLRDHPDHPLAEDVRPGFAARPLLRVGLLSEALPLLEIATRQEEAAGRAASGLVMADLWVETAAQVSFEDHFRALKTRVQLASAACEWTRAEQDLDTMDGLTRERPSERLLSLTARAQMCQQSQDHQGVVQSVEAAFDVALDIDASSEQLFRLSHLLASVDLRSGSLVTARDRWMMIAGDAQRSGSKVWEMLSRSTAAGAELQLGEFSAASAGVERAMRLAEALPDHAMVLHLRYVQASLHALRGETEVAVSSLKEIVEETSDIGSLRILGQAVMTLGEVYRHMGLLDRAESNLERGERLLRATGQRVSLSRCLAERTLTALGRGDLAAARTFAAGSGMAASLAQGVHLGQERIHAALGRLAEATGDRHALASARRAAIEALDRQASQLGPEHLSRWSSVLPRMEVVAWAGWSPPDSE